MQRGDLFFIVGGAIELEEGLRYGEVVCRTCCPLQLPAKVLAHGLDVLAIASIMQGAGGGHETDIEHAEVPRPARRLGLDARQLPVGDLLHGGVNLFGVYSWREAGGEGAGVAGLISGMALGLGLGRGWRVGGLLGAAYGAGRCQKCGD